MKTRRFLVVILIFGANHISSLQAEVFRWDTGVLIPQTSEITIEPGVELDHLDLQYAQLSRLNLTGSSFRSTLLKNANLLDSNLSRANLSSASLNSANLTGTILNEADLSHSNLLDVNLSEAIVTGANFEMAIGFTAEKLYSTSSYHRRNLQRVNLSSLELSGWNFNGQDLANANLFATLLDNANFSDSDLSNVNLLEARLDNANLSGAIVAGAKFGSPGSRLAITKEQLYSTLSYQTNNLRGIGLWYSDLTGWILSQQDLRNANLSSSTLMNVDLTGARVTGANLDETTLGGFTSAQLYSTLSYQEKNLAGIGLQYNDLTGWDLSGQNLQNAKLGSTILTGADLSGATVTGANFGLTAGFTKEQLYSTASYQEKNLRGFSLQYNDLTAWDLSDQDLTGANLSSAEFSNINLSGANLKNAYLAHSRNIETGIFNAESIFNQWTIFPDGFDPIAVGLTFIMSPAGDLDANDRLDLTDVNLLAAEIRNKSRRAMFDVNSDSWVDEDDLDFWIKDIMQTSIGDADLNGEFNRQDLITVYQIGHYEDREIANSTWETGDWNADGEFTTLDLIKAFQGGGYEHGQRTAVANVPESTCISFLSMAWLFAWHHIRGNRRSGDFRCKIGFAESR